VQSDAASKMNNVDQAIRENLSSRRSMAELYQDSSGGR
jgi:hypothetical protein